MATPPSGTGTAPGAAATLESYGTGGKLPSSWWNVSQQIVKGPYAITTTAGMPGQSSLGEISWKDSTGSTQHEYFDVGQDGSIVKPLSSTPDSNGGFWGTLGAWISQNAEGFDQPGTAGEQAQSNTVVNAVNWTESLGKILASVDNPALWKRLGIGIAAVILLIIAVVVLLHREIPTPAALLKRG